MPTQRPVFCFSTLLCLVIAVQAETLTFIAQFDSVLGATNYSWFSPDNWWIGSESGLLPSGRVPQANETAIVTGSVDAGMSGIRVDTLVLTNGATVMNGSFSTEQLELRSGSSLVDARVNVLSFLHVGGTDCTLDNSTLTVLGIGTGLFSPLPPATAATLNLNRGSALVDAGWLNLRDRAEIRALGPPQNRLVIGNGCMLTSTNTTLIRGSASNPLAIDNSGIVRVDGGRLTFESGIEWQSSMSFGEFRAVATDSHLVFASAFQVPINVTDIFTGAGTNYFLAGGAIEGLAQVGWADTNGQVYAAGNLVVSNSIGGAGELSVVASPSRAGVLTWLNGTISLPEIRIGQNARMLLSGAIGTDRQLSGCSVFNSGVCTLASSGFSLLDGASIHNLPAGLFEVLTECTISGTPMPNGGEFNNAGVFRKAGQGVAAFGTGALPPGPDFNNAGVVDILDGSLTLPGGASSGRFQTAGGGTLWFWGGTHILRPGVVFAGAGPVQLRQGVASSSWQVEGNITVAKLELGENGTVAGPGKSPASSLRIDEFVAKDNGTITNANAAVINMWMLGAPFVVDSTVTVSNSMTVQATNLQLSSSTLNLAASARAVLSPPAPGAATTLYLSRGSMLQNYGRLDLLHGGAILGDALPQNKLTISAGATVTCTNSGLVRASASHSLLVDNSGVFLADNGALAFEGGIDWQTSSGFARFDAASSQGLILFADSFHFPGWTTWIFTGAGTNRFAAASTADGVLQVGVIETGSQSVIPGNLELANDLGGAATLYVLRNALQTGACIWKRGKLSIAALNVNSGGRLLIPDEASAARELSGGAMNISGLLSWPGGSISSGAGAVLNILPGGVMDMSGEAALILNNTLPRTAVRNSGTVVKSGAATTSLIGADFTNSATLEVRTGTLRLEGVAVQNAGTTTVHGGATLGAPTFVIQGGAVTGTGLIDANVVNHGTFSPGSPIGVLAFSPQTDFQQQPGGVLSVDLGGTNPGITYDQVLAGRNVQLSGDLVLTTLDGFVPQPGQAFQVLTCSALSGNFAHIHAPVLPGTVWVPRYTATNATVLLANELSLSAPVISDGLFNLSFGTTPGVTYRVQGCDNLAVRDWQTLASFSGDGSVKTFSEPTAYPTRFFRVLVE